MRTLEVVIELGKNEPPPLEITGLFSSLDNCKKYGVMAVFSRIFPRHCK